MKQGTRWVLWVFAAAAVAGALSLPAAPPAPADDGKLRIICFGAHPDDAEYKAGGVAAMWAAQGHHVKFVSVTNGDIGHWRDAGGPLARRRTAEVEECARLLGIETQVLDLHDGELLPTLENRRTILKLIREWKADIVMSHRQNDYHPDHRSVGQLVQDAGYMVTVPFFCPDVPHLENNPVFLYYSDRFQRPYPFTADIAVGIDSVIDKKVQLPLILASQTLEGGANGNASLWPDDPAGQAKRREQVRKRFDERFAAPADQYREVLAKWYGAAKAKTFRYAEVFEICEYGRRPSDSEIRKLFPFFD